MGGSSGGFQPDGGAARALAGLATTVSLGISAYCIYKHLAHYSLPRIQRYIVRILFVAPVYALGSVLSLRFPHASVGLETVRDVMEAFVVYTFLALVLEYAGGDSTCVNRIKQEPPLRHPFPLCCLSPIARDGRFLRFCKQGTLQFVGVKLVTAVATLVMLARGQYDSPTYQALLLVLYNFSYSVALYCLALFYMGTRPCLVDYSPIPKFLSVKSIVFATYWQSLLLRLAVHDPERAAVWNNFILCLEMVPFSIFLGLAFSHREYQRGIPDASVLSNIQEVLSVKDVVQDATHNFLPAYQDYVLFSPSGGNSGSGNGNGSGGRAGAPPKKKTYRARTWLAGNLDRVALRGHDQLSMMEEEEGVAGGAAGGDGGSGDAFGDDDDNHSLASAGDGGGGGIAGGGPSGGGGLGAGSRGSSVSRRAPTTTSLGTITSSGGGGGAGEGKEEAEWLDDNDDDDDEGDEELGDGVVRPGGASGRSRGGQGGHHAGVVAIEMTDATTAPASREKPLPAAAAGRITYSSSQQQQQQQQHQRRPSTSNGGGAALPPPLRGPSLGGQAADDDEEEEEIALGDSGDFSAPPPPHNQGKGRRKGFTRIELG